MALLGMGYTLGAVGESLGAALAGARRVDSEDAAALLRECTDHLQALRAASRRVALPANDDRLAVLFVPGASLSLYLQSLDSFVAAALDALEETGRAVWLGGAAVPTALERVHSASTLHRLDLARRARLDVALLPIITLQMDDPLLGFEGHLEALVEAAEGLRGRMAARAA
jgi:hypothetical protein